VGINYSPVTLGASGGTPPYRWSIVPGTALPAGLLLSSDGVVSGTPTAAGGQFTVHLDDSGGQAQGASTSINIVPYLSVTPLCVNGCTVEQQCATVCGSYASLAGGIGPFQLVGYSALPPGTTPGAPALGGSFTQPSSAAPFQFTGDIVDSVGATAKVQALFNVLPHVVLGNGVACCNGNATTVRLPISGGDGKVSNWTFQNLPTSVLTNKPLAVTASVVGGVLLLQVPAGYNPPLAPPFMVTLYDGSMCGPGYYCSAQATVAFNLG
jgi:hypothetical protein